MSVITLTLLHPGQAIPLQNWSFDTESIIRIGRSDDNDVVLYSVVVSRHHLEIRRNGEDWELENLGANGTYIDGKAVTKTAAVDGMIVRLASSGPQIQIRITSEDPRTKFRVVENINKSSLQEKEPSQEIIIS